uniref:Btz domain-containing protein n=1 Tax=Elaeophora elaphi TaxID=1147741 RepID=A0A0R3S0D1_9BILA
MSSMDAEPSESFPGNSDKSVDHSHDDPQAVGFSHDSFQLKEGSSENTSEALESEKHDSVAASAGSSPPPSSAAPDELHMDTDTKSNSEEGDHKESNEVKNDSGKEVDGSKTDGDGDDKTDTEEGEGEEQKEEKMEGLDVSDKAENKAIDTTDKKEEGSAKRILPKWMVQDADAPPSPKEEADEKDVAVAVTENEPSSGARGRGRGRKGRDTTRAVAKPHNEAAIEQSQPESLASGRPRRSTRSNVDYAHPDVATVVAEQEDLENEFQLQQKVSRSRGRGRGRGRGGRTGGRKRAAADSDDGEDSDSEYGSNKKRKRAGSSGSRGRGRGRGRGRPSRNLGKKSNKDESDDDDEEMDLSDNDVGGSAGSGEESYKPAPSKRRAATFAAEAHSPKTPPKKRGRAPAAKMH